MSHIDVSLQTTLDRLAFTRGLDREQQDRVAEIATLVAWEAGAIVFREGDRDSLLYVVDKGRLALEIAIPGRGRVTMLTVGPGEVFGWSSLFSSARQDRVGPDGRTHQGSCSGRGPAPCPLRRRHAPGLHPDAADSRRGLRAAGGHPDAIAGHLRSLTRSRGSRRLPSMQVPAAESPRRRRHSSSTSLICADHRPALERWLYGRRADDRARGDHL